MRNLVLILGVAALFPVRASGAQLAPPNQEGVSMGHLHLLVRDVDVYRKFFIALGGEPTRSGTGLKFPGVIISFMKGDPSAGTAGSVVNHFAFKVRNMPEAMAKWQAAGLNIEVTQRPDQRFVHTPDDLIRIEFLEDKTLATPVAFHHIHYYVADPGPGGGSAVTEIQAWYARVFGAKPGKRGTIEAADLPGVNLSIAKSDAPTVGTKGRVLDHIGFEIKDLAAFCKRLEASGIKLDRPLTARPDLGLSLAYFTDPWGTYIELTEGMNKF
jgi:catechol 2,3-dioxygenase-like lactoylglutathione lyase family enzyme